MFGGKQNSKMSQLKKVRGEYRNVCEEGGDTVVKIQMKQKGFLFSWATGYYIHD